MRVAMITAPVHPLPPTKGAAVEWWMLRTAQRLASEHQADVHLLAPAHDHQPLQEQRDGVQLHRIRIGRLYKRLFQKLTRLDPLPYPRRAARILAALKPDILHVHNAPALFDALTRALPGLPAILHMHNDKALPTPQAVRHCWVPSQYLKSLYAQRVPHADLEVITNGVDTDLFAAPAAPLADLPAQRTLLLYVGRMSPEKGPLELLQAFVRLRARRPDVFLLMAGEMSHGGPNCTRTRYGEHIRQLAAAHAEDCRVLGIVPPQDIQRVYRCADLVLVPSRFEEPFGMVAIEAMASGAPVAAARRGGLVEFIRHQDTGFLLDDIDQPDALADQLDRLLDAPDTLRAVAQRGREYVRLHHDWREVARQTHDAYLRVLNTPTA